MARCWTCGFEGGTQMVFDVTQPPGGGAASSSTPPGVWSAYNSGTNMNDAAGSLGGNKTELYVGIRLWRLSLGGLILPVGLRDNGTRQVAFGFDTGGHLVAYRGNGSALLGTGSVIVQDQMWSWFEMRIVFDNTSGVVTTKINGVTDLTLTGLDTSQSGNAYANEIDLFTNNWGGRIDDVVVNDTLGGVHDSWPGERKISGLVPNGAGDHTGLSRGGTDSGTNYGQVDERPPNDDTDYVYGSNVDDYDLYTFPDLTGYTDVDVVTVWQSAKKSDASAGSIAPVLKNGGTEATGTDQALGTSYAYSKQIYDVDPSDSAGWTVAKVNSLQAGPKAR